MADARIDQAALAKLVIARLESVTGLTVVYPREADPDANGFIRMLPLKVDRRPRTRDGQAGEPDVADVEGELLVAVGPGYGSSAAGDAALQKVVDALDERTLRESFVGDATHQLDLGRLQTRGLVHFDEEKRVEVLGAAFRGTATRTTGTSTLSLLA